MIVNCNDGSCRYFMLQGVYVQTSPKSGGELVTLFDRLVGKSVGKLLKEQKHPTPWTGQVLGNSSRIA